jgi:hypothetical protein
MSNLKIMKCIQTKDFEIIFVKSSKVPSAPFTRPWDVS